MLAGSFASTGRNPIDLNGMLRAISAAAVSRAILPGRRITNWDRRYQNPDSAGRASRSAARWSRFGARAFTRGPAAQVRRQNDHASAAAISATSVPAMPIERRKFWGNTVSDATAAATVNELNAIVRPAVASVRRSASTPKPARADSSR